MNKRRHHRRVAAYTSSIDSGTNRQHKDRLFKALFGSPERKGLTLELYNAMNGSSYTNPEDIQLTTIEDVVYMGMKNDVSFLLDQVMSLWEQQSTPNRNMPLRFLLYYAHLMERYVNMLDPRDGDIYSSAMIHLPTPRLVLFYNGYGVMPEYMYLSQSYENNDNPDVEVRVRLININSGHDQILDHCQPLQDYTTFVEAFHRYRTRDNLRDRTAASRAIEELPSGDVKNYLRAHESEVLDMLLTEYDEARTLKAEHYAGIAQGQEQMLYNLVAQGDLAIDIAVKNAAAYGVVDEADFRQRASALGIRLPD